MIYTLGCLWGSHIGDEFVLHFFSGHRTIFAVWKSYLTRALIDSILLLEMRISFLSSNIRDKWLWFVRGRLCDYMWSCEALKRWIFTLMYTCIHNALTCSIRNAVVGFAIIVIAGQYFSIIIIGYIVVQKVILEEYFKLVLSIDYLFCVPFIYWELVWNFLHSINCKNRESHQRTITAWNSCASPFEISKALFSDLNPTIHKTGIDASLVFGHLSLEQYFIIGVLQVYLIILRE